jgi:phospholipid/cholesterol/gamma-HCH transport system ATP-binding protein
LDNQALGKVYLPKEGAVSIPQDISLSMLFQQNALFDSFTVLENLTFPALESGTFSTLEEARIEAFGLLEKVELKGKERLFPHEISGGMQKRLAIARALMVRPDILLYDDPTAGLDPITSRTIADLMMAFQKDLGHTSIVVTNDVHRAEQLGDQVHLLAKGSLFHGACGELQQFIQGNLKGPLTDGLGALR